MIDEQSIHSQNKYVSLAIFAWNEEAAISSTLNSIFEQSFFEELHRRGQRCEVTVVVNGCTDRTPEVAGGVFEQQSHNHPFAASFTDRVANIPERGKVNAWNKFVHSISAREAQFLFMMDADILIHRKSTLWNMLRALEDNVHANVAVDTPRKDISFKSRHSLFEKLSMGTTRATMAAPAQLCGQLYCIRTEIARNIFLPRDLAACEDGFIKTLVCTDFLTCRSNSERICVAPDAEHTFEAYVSPTCILRNQKRQIIGQTIVHLLADNHLKQMTLPERLRMADTLERREKADPGWLKRLIAGHLAHTRYFWQLYPGLTGQRFKSLASLPFGARLRVFPAALLGSVVSLISAHMAYKALKQGATDYWPKARRSGLVKPNPEGSPVWVMQATNPNPNPK